MNKSAFMLKYVFPNNFMHSFIQLCLLLLEPKNDSKYL